MQGREARRDLEVHFYLGGGPPFTIVEGFNLLSDVEADN